MRTRPHITFRQLRAALAVRQVGSFRRAAELLGLSQPALSLSIAEIEAQLGFLLFDRTSRAVTPTPDGEDFLSAVARPLHDLDQLVGEAAEGARSRRGRVVVGCLASVASQLMPAAILECARRYPAIEPIVSDDVAIRLPDMVARRQVDFAVTMPPRGRDRDLAFTAVMREDFALVLRADHALAQRRAVSWKALAGEALLAFSNTGGSHAIVEAKLSRLHVQPAKVTPVSQIITIHALIAAGLGIAVLPRLAWPLKGAQGLVVRPFSGAPVEREIGILALRERSLSSAAQGLVEAIEATARQL
jgi:DNA-binding transcriptional LysR family regulator